MMWRMYGLTTRDHVVDQWLLALEKVLLQDLIPIVAIEHELVLEEIDVGSLIPRSTLDTFRPIGVKPNFGLPR